MILLMGMISTSMTEAFGYDSTQEANEVTAERIAQFNNDVTEAIDEHVTLGNASMVAGLLPGGGIVSLVLAATGMLINDDFSSIIGAATSEKTNIILTKKMSKLGTKPLSLKQNLFIFSVSVFAGTAAGGE